MPFFVLESVPDDMFNGTWKMAREKDTGAREAGKAA
jgi:hypothetical protein